MPVLNRIGETYAAQGLAVLAINLGEDEARYEAYVASTELPYLRWARASSGGMTRAYGVRSIPVTYLLDREGVIRAAHVGYSGDLEAKLAGEVAALFE